ncbi:MAG: beta-lactamase family protein [Deltaproteobacteria bacterium]|nr:beta-lactamase family protein [Deltaproteobacteria bacterium]
MKEIDGLFYKAIEDMVFPSASLLVFEKEKILYQNIYGSFTYEDKRPVDKESLYDIASLTKPLVVSLLLAFLYQMDEIDLEDELGFYFKEYKKPEKLGITIREMLNHRSGLPSYREYFKEIPEDRWGLPIARDVIIRNVLNENIENRGKTVYSDIDFIILGYLIEIVTTTCLREFFIESIAKPLALRSSDFCGNQQFRKEDRMVPVSENYIGVDDENSRAMGGIAGHSGLFSTVDEVHKILLEVFNSYNNKDFRIFKPPVMREVLKKSNDFQSGLFRGGFDTPLLEGSQYGDYFLGETIAHLGFTGTSFAIDLNSGFGIILFTNRVCPDRTNMKIREFRRLIHNTLCQIFYHIEG